MGKKILLIAAIFVFSYTISNGYAGDARAPYRSSAASSLQGAGSSQGRGEALSEGFKEIGFFSGYTKGNLKEKEAYEVIPLMLRFGYDLRPKLKIETDNIIEFMLEPFVNFVAQPQTNIESGCNFLLKYGYRLNDKLYPYVEAGVGMIHLTQQMIEQSTQFNFTQHVGGGISYFLRDNIALSAGYRYRHLSNASIKKPNNGIDNSGFICGVSVFY